MEDKRETAEWKDQAHELFEFSAGYYAKQREHDHWYRQQLGIALGMLDGATGTILDIGCAAGSEIPSLRERQFTVTGMEFSAGMLAYAQRRFADDPGVRLVRGDAEFLPFPAASFDHVICLGVLEYLPDHRPAIHEIARVLRPGGRVVFSIPNGTSPYYITSGLAQRFAAPVWRGLRRLAGKGAATPDGGVPQHRRNLGIPRRFERMLRDEQMEPEHRDFCTYFIFPLDRLWPAADRWLAVRLEPLLKWRALRWTGCQYLLAARRVSKGS